MSELEELVAASGPWMSTPPIRQVHEGLRLQYWPIPRCGCTSMGEYLRTGLFRNTADPVEGMDNFAMFRNPVDRYLSSLEIAWRQPKAIHGTTWEAFIALVIDHNNHNPLFIWEDDLHFHAQVESLVGFDGSLTRFDDLPLVVGWLQARGVHSGHDVFPKMHANIDRNRAITDMIPRQPILEHYARDVEVWGSLQPGIPGRYAFTEAPAPSG